MSIRGCVLACLAGCVIGWPIAGQVAEPVQGEKPSFEVASVKPNRSNDNRVMLGNQPGGGFTATNVALRTLMIVAYQLQDFQIVNAPDWAGSERFDIAAKASVDGGPATGLEAAPNPALFRQRLQALLADRFKLAAHNDTKQLPIYNLVLARSDGSLGPQLRPSSVDCEAATAANRGRGPGMPAPGARPSCGMMMAPGKFVGGSAQIPQLVQQLSVAVHRVVVDRTGLSGRFDLELSWTPDQMPAAVPGGPTLPPVDPNGPSIFTALQEQLGLKLESATGPVPVLVVDHVERPSEN